MSTHPKSPEFRNHMLQWIAELNHKQFAEFFYEAVAHRTTSDLAEWQGHFILADTESVDNGAWDIDFIALPVKSERHEWSDEALICQSGTCDGCNTDVRSWSKRAECPVCGNAVGCT